MMVFAIFRKGLLVSVTLLKSLEGCGRGKQPHTL